MAGTYEMLWDCGFCGAKKNLGKTHRHCPSCGAAQDEEARYFPSDADKVKVEDHVFVGRDKICPACDAPMAATATHCGGCGAPLDGAREVELVQDTGAAPGPETKKLTREEKRARREVEAKELEKKQNKKGCLIATGLFGSFLSLATYLGWSSPVGMEVTSQRWERTIAIEVFGPVARSAWCDEVPSGSRVTARTSKVRSTKKIPDGESCTTERRDNGDGTFTETQKCVPKYREEDIEAPHCDYEIDDWSQKEVARSTGEGTTPRNWPVLRPLRAGSSLGSEREGARKEVLTVTFVAQEPDDEGKKVEGSCEVSAKQYPKLTVGSRWEVGVMNMGGLDCSEIREPGSGE